MVAVNWEQEEADSLLGLPLEHWFVVCGFSFAGLFMEIYEKKSQASLQKCKGLRKKLIAKPDKENQKSGIKLKRKTRTNNLSLAYYIDILP